MHLLQNVQYNQPISLLAVVSFLPWLVWKFPENLKNSLFCKVPTMHVGHLPVGDIHLLVIPQGQWKCDSISSSKDPWDVGLHHLQGGQRWALVGFAPYMSRNSRAGVVQGCHGPSEHREDFFLAVGPPGEISFSLLHLQMRTHMQGPTVSLS